jgi:hypothetical protein
MLRGASGSPSTRTRPSTANLALRVFGVSNCHVLRKTTTIDYQFKGTGAPPQLVRVSGSRRFQRAVDEINDHIDCLGSDVELLAAEIAELEPQLASNDPDEVEEVQAGVMANQTKLA